MLNSPPAVAEPLSAEQQFDADLALVLQCAFEAHQKGEANDAHALYQAVLEAKPGHAEANYGLGVLLAQLQRPADALPHLEAALGAAPDNLQYWGDYINALVQADQIEAAWVALEMGQQRGLRGPAVDVLIAQMSLLEAKREANEPAPPALDKADVASLVALERPAAPVAVPTTAPVAAAVVDNATKPATQPAAPVTTNAVASAPVVPVAPAVQASTTKPTPAAAAPAKSRPVRAPSQKELERFAQLYNKGHTADAIKLGRELTKKYPGHGASWRFLGLALHRNGQYHEALEVLSKSVELAPEHADAGTVHADLLRLKGMNKEAQAAIQRVIEASPNFAEAHRVSSSALAALGRTSEAIAAAQLTIELAPEYANAHSTLATALLDHGDIDGASRAQRRALELAPNDALTRSNLLFALTHREDITPEQLLAESREFASLHEAPLRAQWPKHDNDRNPERTLRIGIVSGDLIRHAVASYLEPVLKHMVDDAGLQIYIYNNHLFEDFVTARFRAMTKNWRDVAGLTDTAFAEQIRRDRIDVLLDLSGHTGRNRLVAFARKPAPVQASWIGYPGTTGLASIDYHITNKAQAGAGIDGQFTEKLAWLPSAAPFRPEENAPPLNALPALSKGYVTFGSFNRINKLRPEVIKLWARLLHAVPNSRMLLGGMPEGGMTDEVVGWFADAGIGRERLDLRPRASLPVYLQQHHHVDICLDTFPYAGSTTTLHALWMGVPTITLAGQSMPGRAGATLLKQVGLEQFIATSPDDYVAKGVALAADLPALVDLRNTMRRRCLGTARFQPALIATHVSEALRTMWKRWCADLPPESFEVADTSPAGAH